MTNEQKLKETVFFVEANDNERHSLWKDYHKETDWEQDMSGFMTQVGCIDKNKARPVWVSFTFILLYGKRVCFYHATSNFVDHEMVEQYIKTNYPVKWDNDTRIAMTDANNFHHAIDRCKNEE